MKAFFEKVVLICMFSFLTSAFCLIYESALNTWPRAGTSSWNFIFVFGCLWLIGLIMFSGMMGDVYVRNWPLVKICKNTLKSLALATLAIPIFWVLGAADHYKRSGDWIWRINIVVLLILYLFTSWAISSHLAKQTNKIPAN